MRVLLHSTPVCRVIVPVPHFRQTQIETVLWHHGGFLVTGAPGELFRLGALMRIAAVSPHSVIFLPLSRSPQDRRYGFAGKRYGHLVLMRQDVRLKPSMWPALRAQVRRGTPAKIQAPAARDPQGERGWDWQQRLLKLREHAGTVFLTGSPQALFDAGDELTSLAAEVHKDSSLVTQFNGSGQTGRRDDDWELWVLARSRTFGLEER